MKEAYLCVEGKYCISPSFSGCKFLNWLILTGEGNDNPLQYSCLENPRDGGAW